MSTATPTPAPWEPRYVLHGMPTDCVQFGIIGPDGLEVARVWRREDLPVITAAPKLLAALKAVVPGECPIVTHHRRDCVWCAALKVIAEAERPL